MRNREEAPGAKVWSRTNLAIQKRTHRNWETVADQDRRDTAAAAGTNRPKWKEGMSCFTKRENGKKE